jgi:drug/metabolite transporter (DMT)-like permease
MILSPIWLPVTLLAALFQCWRTALQQRLRGQLSINGAGVVRYLYGVPVAALYLGGYLAIFGGDIPSLSWRFLAFTLGGGVAQIIATNLLIMAFGFRSFAVGTAYSKTEVMQSAVLALLLLDEQFSALAWVGVAISLSGVLYLSLAGRAMTAREILAGTMQPAALCGLAAGFGFGMASVCIKAANFSLPTDDRILAALLTLFLMNGMQTLLQGAYLAWREPDELRKVFTTWRSSSWVGLLSASGSSCWFIGFATAPVGLVRAVGQVEILFTLLFSRFYLKEGLKRTEAIGALILVSGVVLVVLGR